ncbi:MAG: membrane protein insertion efficiency factor YidD [Bacteroidota bacterium]
MRTFFILIIFSGFSFAQTDWVKWDKKDVSYEVSSGENQHRSLNDSNLGSLILSGLKFSYSFFISDVDGDNCPFYPSCSSFYISSIKETNFIQGTLMFADRFTRDSNLFKSRSHYPKHISGKFFDPTYNYYLIQDKVQFYSRYKIVE